MELDLHFFSNDDLLKILLLVKKSLHNDGMSSHNKFAR